MSDKVGKEIRYRKCPHGQVCVECQDAENAWLRDHLKQLQQLIDYERKSARDTISGYHSDLEQRQARLERIEQAAKAVCCDLGEVIMQTADHAWVVVKARNAGLTFEQVNDMASALAAALEETPKHRKDQSNGND